MKDKFSKFINLQGKYLTSLLILLTMGIGQMWGTVTTEVYNASGASSSVDMVKTGSTLAGTYIAGQGGGNITNYSPSNKGVKLRTQQTKVTVSETEYGYAVITANSGYSLKSFKIEGTSNGSNSIDLLGVYVDVDATNATTLAADLATATNQLSSAVTFPNKSTNYVSSPALSINASSNIVLKFPGTGDNQMRAIITIGYEEASSGGGEEPADETAPAFVSSVPANGATGVAVEGTIVLTFDEAIASVDASKFSLSGATKGTVAIDGTDSKKVNVPYSGAENSATVTLSVAADAVADAAGNKSAALSDISFTTVAAAAPVVCPESGVVYSLTMKSATLSGVTQNNEVALAGDYATEDGGTSYLGNKNSTTNKAQVTTTGSGTVYFNGGDAYIKVVLDCPIKTGDELTFENGSGDKQVCFTTTTTRATDYSTSSNKYTFPAAFNDVSTFYVWRASGNGTYLHSLTITRPYDVSFVSAHGTAPTTPTKAVSLTLTELSDASFEHTGWTADKAVKVGGDTKAAGTALAVDAVVELTDNTTFTATWEAKVTKYTVTYYDDATELGTELVNEGSNPTATGIVAPKKVGYTFAGWSTSNGGAAVALNTISVAADMPLYAVYTAVNCATLSGTIFSLAMDVAPAANCTIRSGSGYETEADLDQYAAISGGIAIAKNSSTSNHLIITTTPTIKFAGGNGKVHIQFDCALKEGDKIKTTISSQNIAYTTTDSRSTTNYFTKGTDQELTITAGHPLENATEIYLWAASSSNGELTSLQVIRPEKYSVSFNMHGHGDAVETQYIIEGGKVTVPATTDIEGWDFGGWYQTYVADPESYSDAWDFANDVVGTSAIELHAKWTEHVLSSDATLSDLTVNGVTVEGFATATEEYNVELPFGTTDVPTVAGTANDANAKSVEVTQASSVSGDATVVVTAENDDTKTYTIHFSVATSKDLLLVFKTGSSACVGSPSTSTQIKSNNAAVSTYINPITFTNVEGEGDNGAEGSSLNVGKKAGNMFTLKAKAGYAFSAMSFLAKIQDANCEYSLDGADWTTLASTNTDGDECYAPFATGEVHEFRLRSTGASGVWIRNMQLTIIEACTPIKLAWDEEPVEFEVGKAGQVIAATANNGGTVTYSSNAPSVNVDASTGALTVNALASVTLSAATAEGDGTTYCANGGTQIVINKVVKTYYLIQFDLQNETSVGEYKYFNSGLAIMQPADPTYSGYNFQGWFDAATGGNPIAWPLVPTASMTIYAQWVAQCDGPTITAQPASANYLTGRAAAALTCEATAGAAGALTYTWYSCDDDARTNPVELAGAPTPSTAVAGTFYYYCAVTEDGCDVVRNSDVATITVADKDGICLIKATHTGATTATVEGKIGGEYDKNTQGGGKLGSNDHYFGVKLAEGTFQAGDIVEIYASTTSTKVQIFSDKGENMLDDGVFSGNIYQFTLTDATEWIYLYRTSTAGSAVNPTLGYIAVYRPSAPILKSVTVAGVEGKPVSNVVTIEVAASTTQSQLEAITYDWISNNDAWTAAHTPVATNAWEFGVTNTVTFTDKDGDASVYTITVNKAIASTNVELATLTVNGNAITVVPGQSEYNYELPYGTTAAPVVVATAEDANANVGAVTADINSATFTVTAEDGTTTRDYTINFSVSKWAEVVIWDGSAMSAVATSPDAVTGFAWAVTGFSSISNYNATCGTKAYTKCLPSGGSASATRNVAFTVPAGYVAKFYIAFGTHSDGSNRGMFIASNAVKKLEDAESVILTLYSDDREILVDGTSEIVGAGTYYLDPMESVDFYEIRAYLRPGYGRTSMLGNGVYGTVCVDHNVAVEDIQGVTVYELMGRDYSNYGKLAFDEIVSGELEAGVPYVFQAHGEKMLLFFGATKVDDPVDKHNGMYGTFEQVVLTELTDVYYFAQRALWSCDGAEDLTIPANRAYVKLSEVGEVQSTTPAPGRRRITMNVNGEKVTTDIDNLNAGEQPMKVMIDGQIFIIRGEKMFDVTGKLVK